MICKGREREHCKVSKRTVCLLQNFWHRVSINLLARDHFLTSLPPQQPLTTSLQAMSFMNYLKSEALHMKLIFRHFLLSAVSSLSPSVSLLSVILVMICIPVALGWSELVPTDATCQACWVRLDWAALFFPYSYTGLLVGDFSLSFPTHIAWACLNSRFKITSVFFFLQSSVNILKCCFYSRPNQVWLFDICNAHCRPSNV